MIALGSACLFNIVAMAFVKGVGSASNHIAVTLLNNKTQVGTTTTTYQAVVAANANGGNRKASS